MMPARGNRLRHETFAAKILRLDTLRDFPGCEAVAVGGKGFDFGFGVVGGGEPGGRVEVLFGVRELVVDGARDEEVYSVAQVLDEADCVYEAGGCRD